MGWFRQNGSDEKVMDFWEHLEELRWVLVKSVGVLMAAVMVGLLVTRQIYDLLLLPLEVTGLKGKVELVYSGPVEPFWIKLKMALLAGVAMATPFIVMFVWSFVSPGLKHRERKAVYLIGGAGTVFFLLGATFAYALLFQMLPVLVSFGEEGVRNLWTLKQYIDFCVQLMLGVGVSFELPVVIVVLARVGLVSVPLLKRGRPYAVVIVFVLAAVLTPTGDAFTLTVVGLPLAVLYEFSIWACWWQDRRLRRIRAEDEAASRSDSEKPDGD